MSEKPRHHRNRSAGGERVTSTPSARDRRSGQRHSPETAVSQKQLPDGRRVVNVHGYTVKRPQGGTGESTVALPKRVFLEGAARIVAQDIVRFTKVAHDVVTFTRTARSNLGGLREAKAAK